MRRFVHPYLSIINLVIQFYPKAGPRGRLVFLGFLSLIYRNAFHKSVQK